MRDNLMEEKQLNFNAPLMSVRRFASSASSFHREDKKVVKNLPKKPALPFHKPEFKSGPVTNAGSVPFLWEQIPGRPKDYAEHLPESPDLAPLAPKLPPGRNLDGLRRHLQDGQKQKSGIESSKTESPAIPIVMSTLQNNKLKQNVASDFTFKELMQEEGKPISDEDNDDAFSDALDTLSRSESFFMNCSISGVSALDGLGMKSSGSSSIDPEAKDFMMGRFLPAAKAMTSETPQYSLRKPLVTREQATVSNRVDVGRRPIPYVYRPPVASQESPGVDEDSEDDLVDYDETSYLSAKACGLLPRLCLKSSLCLLNPVPGMKVRSQTVLSPASRKLRAHTKASSSSGSFGQIEDEQSWEAVYKYKLTQGVQSRQTLELGSKHSSESNRLSGSQTPEGSSPYKRSAAEAISPYHNEAIQSPFHEGISFLGIPKEARNIKGDGVDSHSRSSNSSWGILKSHHASQPGSGSSSPTRERTLYVDSVQVLDTPKSVSSSDTKDLMSPTYQDPQNLEGEELRKSSVLEYEQNIHERVTGQSEMYEADEPKVLSESRCIIEKAEGLCSDNESVAERLPLSNDTQLDDTQPSSSEGRGDSFTSSGRSLLPPPLPKSPSESWLWRTLPSASKNPSSGSYLGVQLRSRKQLVKSSSSNPKWESIVKKSNVQRGYSRFSEELNKSVPQQ